MSCDSIVPQSKYGCRGPKPSLRAGLSRREINDRRSWREGTLKEKCNGTITHAEYDKYKAECALVEDPCGNVARQYQ